VAVVIALGVYPHFVLDRTETDTEWRTPHEEVSVIR
jgi:hypothetical protein